MLVDSLAQALLGNELRFLSSKSYRSGRLWEVEKLRSEFEICRRCGEKCTVRAGRATVLVREAPIRTEQLWLRIQKHRYMCKRCKKPFTEVTPGVWPGRRTTQQFRKAVALNCEKMTDLSRVRKDLKISSGLVYRIFYEQCEVKLRERKNQPWPEAIGIDEHFFRRKQRRTEFVTVVTNLRKRRLFELALGKDTKSLTEQLMQIPGRENVKLVVIDMSDTYRSLVKKMFPNARIVADKFHVLRLMNPALIRTRREIHGHRKDLEYRRMLLRNEHNLDYEKRFELWRYLEKHPRLRELHWFKEKLHSLYRARGVRRATQSFNQLMLELERSSTDEVVRLRRTLLRWKETILQYFATPYTNALTEAMNGRAKLLQRRASGYRSFKNYRLRVLTACGF